MPPHRAAAGVGTSSGYAHRAGTRQGASKAVVAFVIRTAIFRTLRYRGCILTRVTATTRRQRPMQLRGRGAVATDGCAPATISPDAQGRSRFHSAPRGGWSDR